MERELPPPPGAGQSGPTVAGLLAQWAVVERPASPPPFVDGMGRWLGWKEAIPLSAVLQSPFSGGAGAAPPSPPIASQLQALVSAFNRVHDTLTQAILSTPSPGADPADDFLPFRRRYQALQQAMETAIGPLRTQLRAAVARLSPQAAQLAALDAVMASALAGPEQAQLAQLPALLDKHFTRLRQAQPGLNNDTPWLDTFRQDMQRLLLAELALRLQPAQGLLEALRGTPEGRHE